MGETSESERTWPSHGVEGSCEGRAAMAMKRATALKSKSYFSSFHLGTRSGMYLYNSLLELSAETTALPEISCCYALHTVYCKLAHLSVYWIAEIYAKQVIKEHRK